MYCVHGNYFCLSGFALITVLASLLHIGSAPCIDRVSSPRTSSVSLLLSLTFPPLCLFLSLSSLTHFLSLSLSFPLFLLSQSCVYIALIYEHLWSPLLSVFQRLRWYSEGVLTQKHTRLSARRLPWDKGLGLNSRPKANDAKSWNLARELKKSQSILDVGPLTLSPQRLSPGKRHRRIPSVAVCEESPFFIGAISLQHPQYY